jgi:HEAT repeat protein
VAATPPDSSDDARPRNAPAPPEGTAARTPAAAEGENAEPPPTVPFLVLQFFVFPLAIVAVCVGVFVVFGMIAGDTKGAREYVAEVRSGGTNRRWQAAFELSKVLQAGKDKALADPAFAKDLVRLFDETRNDDPRVRRYLALALGRLGHRDAVPALVGAVKDEGSPDRPADPETRIYALWALGAIADPAALPVVLEQTHDQDPGIRKAAVHALGTFAGTAAVARLHEAVGDPIEDVRWNAALALARRGDATAAPVLVKMLDRKYLAMVPSLTADQQEEVIVQAAAAAGSLTSPELKGALTALLDGDPSLRVREAARVALGGRPSPPSR